MFFDHSNSHASVWAAIDRIASDYDLTASGLAIELGMHPTAFNKSKRTGPGGRLRWPSSETIARILARVGMTFSEFGALVDEVAA
ncbi:hypothetical protein C7I85_12110 [Mesorhizobium soli]|uniref:DNA-binding protein n=2 Tax=Pseudaminobacter soli (ex Li et al. 2025) TaxID=1295366 RepID=A0A2P7SE54_9HYPH|nr:hypothetical protein C7I85_12110 [Mesorhizobium soli]